MIHIACCTDDAYAEHCGVLMVSICENKGNDSVYFHVLTSGFKASNENALRSIVKRYGQSLEIYKVDENDLKNCPIRKNDRVSIAAYFRILLPVILPESIHKVLYLDCDILVLKSLDELWNINIDNYSAGVVMDQQGQDIRKFNNLEYDMALVYFNSGVMLINLDYWRKDDITSKTLTYINSNPEKLKWWDQEALNYILKNTKFNLPLRFNVQEEFYWKNPLIARKYWEEMYEASEKPVILHYNGAIKPWYKECVHPKTQLYRVYKAKTPWKGTCLRHIRFYLRVYFAVKKLSVVLGFRKEINVFR